MAFVLARLRLAIQLSAARRSTAGIATFLGGWAAAVAAGLGGAFAIAWLDAEPSGVGEFLVLVLFTLVFFTWVLSPIMISFSGGDVIDPTALEQYPLGRGEQIAGLLLGGLLGPASVATFLFASGGVAVASASVGLGERMTSLGGALLFTVLCASASYAVRSALAAAFASRRGRDVAVFVSVAVLIAVYAGQHFLSSLMATAQDAATPVIDVVSWFPPGAAASLAFLVGGGDWAGAAARFGVVIATIAIFLAVWAWALHRHVLGHSASRSANAPARASSRALALVPAVLAGWRPGAALGAASQQLRYYFFRAPKAVQFIVAGPVVAIFFGATQMNLFGLPVAAAIAAAAMGYTGLLNLFGNDGRGVELTVQTGASLASVLRGKLAAVSLYLVPATAALAIGFGAFTGRMPEVPQALVAAFAAVAFAYAVGALSSAFNPYDVEHPQGNRSAIGQKNLGFMALLFGGVAGVAWLVGWSSAFVPVWISLGVLLVLAAAAAIVATAVAGRALDRSPERLLAAFTPR